jgi:hypothetical protein
MARSNTWGDTDTLASKDSWTTDTETLALEDYPEPSYTTQPLPTEFRSLTVSNTSFQNLSISLPNSSSTLFYVNNSSWTPGKPSVTLSKGSKEGPILGVLKIGAWRENTVGLGDPNKGEINWETLKKTSNWTHGTYEFEFGGMRNRRRFTWQRTRQPIFGDQPDLELRENVDSGATGDVLAVYKGCQGLFSRVRGTFYVMRGVHGRSDDEKWDDWEVMVLLTGCGIIEASRRRARARRRAAGGGA